MEGVSDREILRQSEMEHAISIDKSATSATRNRRLEALKNARNVMTLDNQQPVVDGDLNKIMDLDLYEATKTGDANKFIDVLEAVSESRRLALSLIFDQVTPSGNSLLHVAASSGSEHVMELILFHFPRLVTQTNCSEDTPLHVAIRDGRLNATRMLIFRGRDSDVMYWKNKDNKSPLYLAVETQHSDILRLLLEASARDETYAVKIQGMSPTYAVKIQGMSPILAALEEGKSGILEKIIDRLPKLLLVLDGNGRTPLHSAASVQKLTKMGQWSSAASDGAVELLLRKCRYLALQADKEGSYPIHVACEVCKVDIIRRLVRMWPDLAEIKNKKGRNILHFAAKGGNNDAVQFILEECGDPDVIKKLVNSKDDDGNTPLHLASMHNHYKVLLYLTKDKRSELGLLNNNKLTALDVAGQSGSPSTKYPLLVGDLILRIAGVPRSKGQCDQSLRKGADWVKDKVSTRLIVATLVATVTFAAGFTLPGGYNASHDPHPGTAIMLHSRVFQVFVISNTVGMYSSIHAVAVLLLGLINDFSIAQQAYLAAGPLLLMSLTCMSVAFMAAVIVAVSKLTWLALLVLSIALFNLATLIAVLAALVFFPKIALRIGTLLSLVEGLAGQPGAGEALAVVGRLIYRNWRPLLKYWEIFSFCL